MKKSGIELIAEERKRQIEKEGYTTQHDSEWQNSELAWAAVSYATPVVRNSNRAFMWPFNRKYWKPTPDDRVRELQKAGALIAADIDRLQDGYDYNLKPLTEITPDQLREALHEPNLADTLCKEKASKLTSLYELHKMLALLGKGDSYRLIRDMGYDVEFTLNRKQ